MPRTLPAVLILALLTACAVQPTESPPLAPVEAPVAVVQPPPPTPAIGPGCVVTVLVGGEPQPLASRAELAAVGHDAITYLGTCRDRADRPHDPLMWEAAVTAPVCVRILFAPPTELVPAEGSPITAGEMLVPLGVPHLDGFVFVRAGSGPHASFLAGDPELLGRLKVEAAGTLSVVAML